MGVMVAVSLEDLMMQSEHERAEHVRAIKQRIHELYEHFGIRFPVYLLLTKADLVAGFMEFFDDLRRDERAQVWGVSFPLEDKESKTSPVDNFDREFDALVQRLNDRVLWRLSQERDLQRRASIQGFPHQVAGLKDTLGGFLRDIFRGSRFEETPMLRGVYITSGTQEGTPIDRLVSSVARTFGLDQRALPSYGGKGRSYFITNLLRKVMFAESELAGTNRRLELRKSVVTARRLCRNAGPCRSDCFGLGS